MRGRGRRIRRSRIPLATGYSRPAWVKYETVSNINKHLPHMFRSTFHLQWQENLHNSKYHWPWMPEDLHLGRESVTMLYGNRAKLWKRHKEQFASHLAYTEHKHWRGRLGCWFFDIPSVIPLTFFLFHSYFELVGIAEEVHLPREDKSLKRDKLKQADDAVFLICLNLHVVYYYYRLKTLQTYFLILGRKVFDQKKS